MAKSTKRNIKLGAVHEALLAADVVKVTAIIKEKPELEEKVLVSFINKIKTTIMLRPNSNETLLYFAILEDELKICKYLIDDGAQLKLPREEFIQPLNFALVKEKYEIARLFMNHGADLLSPDVYGKLPLHYAFMDCTTVEHFLKSGFPVNRVININTKITALHAAVMGDSIDVVKILLKRGAKVNVKCNNDATPINFAVYGNYPHMVKILLNHGANLDNATYITSPLIEAIKSGYLEIIKILIEGGFSVHQGYLNKHTISTLHYAVSRCQPEIVELLLQKGAKVNSVDRYSGNTALLEAANNHIMLPEEKEKGIKVKKIVDILLQYGADIRVKGSIGMSPIDIAIMVDNYDIVTLLLQAGAKSQHFNSILLPAVKGGAADAIRTCLEFGEDFNCMDMGGGRTPYHCALERQRPKVLKTFWKYGCPVDQPLKIFRTDMELDLFIMTKKTKVNKVYLRNQQNFIEAISHNDTQSVLKALENGAEPRGCSKRMMSPIHFVANKGYLEIAEILLEKNVPVNTIVNGEAPIHLAARERHEEICILLLKHGASYNSVAYGLTPLEITQHQDIKKLLRTISRMFRNVRLGKPRVLKELQRILIKDLELFWVLINSTDRSGLTLMATAFDKGHKDIANGIMNCRLKARDMQCII